MLSSSCWNNLLGVSIRDIKYYNISPKHSSNLEICLRGQQKKRKLRPKTRWPTTTIPMTKRAARLPDFYCWGKNMFFFNFEDLSTIPCRGLVAMWNFAHPGEALEDRPIFGVAVASPQILAINNPAINPTPLWKLSGYPAARNPRKTIWLVVEPPLWNIVKLGIFSFFLLPHITQGTPRGTAEFQ